MSHLDSISKGGDLRSLGTVSQVVVHVATQEEFDELIIGLYSNDRKTAMRTADAIEKITRVNISYLHKYKTSIIELFETAANIEIKWHLALLVARLMLNTQELKMIWHKLTFWVTDKKESRIVRVNSLQALYNLLPQCQELAMDLEHTVETINKENIPSINARIKKLRKVTGAHTKK